MVRATFLWSVTIRLIQDGNRAWCGAGSGVDWSPCGSPIWRRSSARLPGMSTRRIGGTPRPDSASPSMSGVARRGRAPADRGRASLPCAGGGGDRCRPCHARPPPPCRAGVGRANGARARWLHRRHRSDPAVTAALLPLAIDELAARVTMLRLAALTFDMAVLVLLVWAKRLFGLRGRQRRIAPLAIPSFDVEAPQRIRPWERRPGPRRRRR
jgi:hypothetical protein